ncbi:S66 peptidase family protein [Rubeoparvulum massiliense]|uniref:S66 peptidase family protein n=1 Tax=Rubeoparvulum massiliense TaxID=1631346 RepID=UPI00065DEFF5|nr:LD-carboxypeptidase [Rubeoparvulum massiliense]
MMVIPRQLQPGDTIGLVAPASPTRSFEEAARAISFLEEQGFQVKRGSSLERQWCYLAGSDEERALELQQLFADPEVKAILAVRGGYGCARMVPYLDFEVIAANPKIIWGYSDLTFLLNLIYQRTGLVTFHGPMLSTDLGKAPYQSPTWQSLQLLQEVKPYEYGEHGEVTDSLWVWVEGKAEGPILGGNLTLLTSTLGTPYELDTRGALLFLEEVNEEPYRIDRMLNQLQQAGKLDACAGFLIGDFQQCEPARHNHSFSLEEVLRHYLQPLGKPVMGGLQVGHCEPTGVIPIGLLCQLDTENRTLVSKDSPVSKSSPVV